MAKNVSLGKYYPEAERLAILRTEIRKGLDDPAFVEGETAFEAIDKIIKDYEGKA